MNIKAFTAIKPFSKPTGNPEKSVKNNPSTPRFDQVSFGSNQGSKESHSLVKMSQMALLTGLLMGGCSLMPNKTEEATQPEVQPVTQEQLQELQSKVETLETQLQEAKTTTPVPQTPQEGTDSNIFNMTEPHAAKMDDATSELSPETLIRFNINDRANGREVFREGEETPRQFMGQDGKPFTTFLPYPQGNLDLDYICEGESAGTDPIIDLSQSQRGENGTTSFVCLEESEIKQGSLFAAPPGQLSQRNRNNEVIFRTPQGQEILTYETAPTISELIANGMQVQPNQGTTTPQQVPPEVQLP